MAAQPSPFGGVRRMGLDVCGHDKPRKELSEHYWRAPLKWDRAAKAAGERRRVFCASMADVFEDHPTWTQTRPRLWDVIKATPNLDWQLLTKRPENFARFLPWESYGDPWPNVWLGVSAENQARWDERVPLLRSTPAAIRFVSYEPALGPILIGSGGIDWLICGGESGPDHRPFDPAWARSIRDQCAAAGIAFLYKQEGGYRPGGTPLIDGQAYHQFPRQVLA